MELLFEELFRKMFKVINGMHFLIRILIKMIFYIFVFSFLLLIVYLFFTGRWWVVGIILGLWALSEIAHYIRKSREEVMTKEAIKEDTKKQSKEILKPLKSKNKNLLKQNSLKNKNLLKQNSLKNKNLLKQNSLKNKNLLKIGKPKNKELLKSKI